MSNKVFILLIFYLNIVFVFCFPTDFGGNSLARKCGKVHLTVSPPPETYLELNWFSDCGPIDGVRPDNIVLYDQIDLNVKSSLLVKIRAADYPDGYYRTNISFGQPRLPGNWDYNSGIVYQRVETGPHCFQFWIASTKGHSVIDSNCLAIHPTWMNDISKQIGSQKIGNLFIPGTHNSGAFDGASFLESFVLNQDRGIWTQLVHGIRYLDFRIGYYGNDGFFVNHAKVRLQRVEPIFQQIVKYLQLAPKEIIVIDFHRFPYPTRFNESIHHQFVSLVARYLQEYALPPGNLQLGRGPTMNEIWAQNKNLIICYKDDNIAREYTWLWRFIPQIWANAQSASSLKSYFTGAIKNRTTNPAVNPMYALMAELTPPAFHLSPNKYNLRRLAYVNRNVTNWFRDEWSQTANIVATDYFLGNDIINIAIDANLQK